MKVLGLDLKMDYLKAAGSDVQWEQTSGTAKVHHSDSSKDLLWDFQTDSLLEHEMGATTGSCSDEPKDLWSDFLLVD